jgi:hypothetical protein
LYKQLILCSIILLVSLSTIVYAQKATSITWDSSTYYQGDNGVLTVNLINDHSAFQICTKQLYLQFDWQQPQNQVYASSDTPCIATGQSHQFSIQFSIPSSASIGQHTYKIVWVDSGILLGSVIVSSDSLNIHDAYEKVYLSLEPTVQQAINQAHYQSPTANNLLTQAISVYNQAITLANQGQYQGAVNDLNQAQTFLSAANTAEQSYQPPSGPSGNPLVGGSNNTLLIIVVVAVIIIIIYYLSTHKKKQTEKQKK